MNLKEKIIKILQKRRELKAGDIARLLGFSRQAVHKSLKALTKEGVVGKKGTAPEVFYYLPPKESRIKESTKHSALILEKYKSKVKTKNSFWTIPKQKTINLHFLLQSSVLFSSKIEGNTLDLNSYLNKAELPASKNKELKEIGNLKDAYIFAKERKLNEKNFLQAHKILSKSFLAKSAQGKYRKSPVVVFGSAGLEYMAPEQEFVASEMSELFALVSDLLEQNLSKEEVCLWGVYLHIMIALVHPFADGNGRIARLAEKWFLAQKLGVKYFYIESEKFYWENLQKYYESLALGVNYWEVDFKRMEKFVKLHLF